MQFDATELSSASQAVDHASPAAPLLDLRGVSVGFGDGPDVLVEVDMQVKAGEFVTLLGPSGCGKSTLLNLAAGLLAPRDGDLSFDSNPISDVNTNVGYITQADTLLPWKSTAANIGLPLKIRKFARRDIKRRVDQYLELMDLESAAKQYPAQLSGGMRRRALLARSMIYNPRMLLMDEPFAALDAQMRQTMHVELRHAVKTFGQTALFVTHDLAEAAVLADRVLMVGGGPPGTVFQEVQIPFGSERDLTTLPFDPEFAKIESYLHELLLKVRST